MPQLFHIRMCKDSHKGGSLPSEKSAGGWEWAPWALQKAEGLQAEKAVSEAMAAGTGHSKGGGCLSRLT